LAFEYLGIVQIASQAAVGGYRKPGRWRHGIDHRHPIGGLIGGYATYKRHGPSPAVDGGGIVGSSLWNFHQ